MARLFFVKKEFFGINQARQINHFNLPTLPAKNSTISPIHTFKKKERLKSRKLIDQSFAGGKGFSFYPIKVIYLFTDLKQDVPLQATVSVSSRNFKKAVDRNRIKRQLREVYRLQKAELIQNAGRAGLQLALFFIYTGKELPLYDDLFKKMNKALGRMNELVNNNKKP